jgi:hypothetical protein
MYVKIFFAQSFAGLIMRYVKNATGATVNLIQDYYPYFIAGADQTYSAYKNAKAKNL